MSFDRTTSVQIEVVVGRIQAQMRQMIEDQLLDVDKMVKDALTPQTVSEAFAKALAEAFKNELDEFFRWGDGKKLVHAAMQATGAGLASRVRSLDTEENFRELLKQMWPTWSKEEIEDEVGRLFRRG